MKHNKILILFLVTTLVVFSSCKKSFLDINRDPNFVTDAPPKALLPNTLVALGFCNSNELGKVAALLMQYNSGISGLSASYDSWNIGSLDNQWSNELYTTAISNMGILLQKTQGKSTAYSGITKLQLAYMFSMATDLWDAVPYSQAARGFDDAGVLLYPQPRFDDQKDIYLGNAAKEIKGLFTLVREGIADINTPSATKPTSDDIVYGGNLTKWVRFGNSLLLKLALQVSNRMPDTTKAIISGLLSSNAPMIDAIDGSLDFNVPFSTANPNAYYLQDVGGSIPNTQMLSTRFLAIMRQLNDSLRLSKFYIKPASTFVGYENGSPFAAPTTTTRSYYGSYVLGTTRAGEAPVRIMTAFRNYFILAEAALRWGTAGDPNVYYQNGIKAAMKSAGLTDAEITTYFTNNPTIVNLTGSAETKLTQIIIQKYISSMGNAIESYNDFRRTGYPALPAPVVTAGDDPNVFPNRYPYTTQEGSSNPNQPNPRPKTTQKVWWAL